MYPSQSLPPLTSCQEKALDTLKRQGNVFLTGAAGTGKSFLLDQYLRGKAEDEFPVVASTGAAAVLVGGRTFHSFFGLGILEGGVEASVFRALKSRRLVERLQRAHCVVIDEISMLSGQTLNAAELIARRARSRDEPWGGLRIIAVGDFAQLPPIAVDGQMKDWAFLHSVWQESDFQPALLSTVMRTQDLEFLKVLNFVREGIVNEHVETFLDSHTSKVYGDMEKGTRLYPHRAQAKTYNDRRLHELPTELRSFPTQYAGEERFENAAKKAIPIPDVLEIKKDSLIMMRKNDPSPERKYVNGSLGTVRSIGPESLHIRLLNGEDILIGQEKFAYMNGDGNEVFSAWNFPVTLAWATTIHKAQGASLDRMIVDLHALWEPGQAYVALSRVRSGAGVHIERWSASSIRAEPLVTALYNQLSDKAKKYVPQPFFTVPERPKMEGLVRTIRRKKSVGESRKGRMEITRVMIERKASLEAIADNCHVKPERILNYIHEMLNAGVKFNLSYLLEGIENLPEIKRAFGVCGFETLTPACEALEGRVSFQTLRLVRCAMLAEGREPVKAVANA